MTAEQIATQTVFTLGDAVGIADAMSGYPALDPFFWAMVKAGYPAHEVESRLRALAGLLS